MKKKVLVGSNNSSDSHENLFLLASSLFLASILSIGIWWLNKFSSPLNPDILFTQVAILSLDSTTYQKISYIAFLAIIAIIGLLFLFRGKNISFPKNKSISIVIISLSISVLFFFSEWFSRVYQFIILGTVFLIAVFLLLDYYFNTSSVENRKNKLFYRVKVKILKIIASASAIKQVWYLIIAIVGILLYWIFPFFGPIFIKDLSQLIWVDGHYGVSVLNGVDLASHGMIEKTYYGMGMPILTGVFLALFDLVKGVDTNLVTVVKFYQLCAIILVFIVLLHRNPKNWMLFGLLAMGLTAWSLSNVGSAVYYPNQSGLRFVPLLLAMFFISFLLLNVKSRWFIWVSGVIAGLTIWLNPETGLALTVALFLIICLVTYSHSNSLFAILRKVFGYFLLLTLTLICSFGLLTPLFTESKGLLDFLLLFGASGYGGLKSELSFTAGIMISLSAYAILDVCLKVGRGVSISSSQLWRVLVSSIILIWHFYYFNRMVEWNLWFNWILFIFLCASYFEKKEMIFSFTNKIVNVPIRVSAGLFFGILAFSVVSGQVAYSAYVSAAKMKGYVAHYQTCSKSQLPVGFCLESTVSDRVRDYLSSLDKVDHQTSIVFSELTTITKLYGFNRGLGFGSPWDGITFDDIRKMQSQINESNYEVIIWPEMSTELALARGAHFNNQIQLLMENIDVANEFHLGILEGVRRDK